MIDAGAMIVAAANEMVFLFVGLELVSIPTYLILYLLAAQPVDAGSGDQVFLPEHLFFGFVALRADVPLRNDRGEQPEGAWRTFSRSCRTCRIRSSAWWRWSS